MIARWLSGLLLLALAAASTWLLVGLEEDGDAGPAAARDDPDLFLRHFTTTWMGPDGQPERELRGVRLEHYPGTDTHEVWQPHVKRFRAEGAPTELRSDHAWLSADRTLLLLNGPVDLWRDGAGGDRQLQVLTRDARVLLDADYVEAEAPSRILDPTGETRSLGLRAWLDRDRLELPRQVESTYQPPRE